MVKINNQIKTQFGVYDKDGNGFITKDEAVELLKELAPKAGPGEVCNKN